VSAVTTTNIGAMNTIPPLPSRTSLNKSGFITSSGGCISISPRQLVKGAGPDEVTSAKGVPVGNFRLTVRQ